MKQYGILGFPAKHSLSPVVQNAAFKALGVDAQFGVFEVDDVADLGEFFEWVRAEHVGGLSVTAPYKEDVMAHLDELSDEARDMGAVNTIVNRGSRLRGENVDWVGIVKALEEVGPLKGKRVVVLGAGGSAKAAVFGLKRAGCEVSAYNRDASKVAALGVEGGGLDEITAGDILVQTTSIWFGDGKLEDLISREKLAEFEVVMDIVYKPLETPLIVAARELGKTVVTGDRMLLFQAFEQFKIWTGEEAPAEEMSAALSDAL